MGAAPPVLAAGVLHALYTTLPREYSVRAKTLLPLATFAKKLMQQLESDNPLHLKALEQCRTVLSEAKNIKMREDSD